RRVFNIRPSFHENPDFSAREGFHFRFAVQLEPNESRTFWRQLSKGNRMRSHGRLNWTPHQYHARHPHQCFVCQRTVIKDVTPAHQAIGARTRGALFTKYERWGLRKRPSVPPPSLAPLATAPR